MSMMAGGPRRPPGKPKIKPPKRNDQSKSIADTWQRLAFAIKEIQNHNASKLSFEEHYRYAYNLVLHKNGDTLYNGVKELVTEHLHKLARENIVPAFPAGSLAVGAAGSSSTAAGSGGMDAVARGQAGETFLKALRAAWDDHTACMKKLRDVLKYMDKVYTASASVPQTWDLGLNLFRDEVVARDSDIRAQLFHTILTQIRLERDGEVINRSAVKSCVDILLELVEPSVKGALDKSVYAVDLEPHILAESTRYYEAEAQRLLETCDIPTYLRRAERRLADEEARTHHYLSFNTDAPLRRLLETHLLTAHLDTIVSNPESGLAPMLDNDSIDDLARLYRLFHRVPEGQPTLRKALKADILERGKTINAGGAGATSGPDGAATPAGDKEAPAPSGKAKGKGKAKEDAGAGAGGGGAAGTLAAALQWVQDVLDLKQKFDRILQDAFGDDKVMQTSMNEGFETFVNLNSKSPEYISLFIDENLKKGLKGKTEDEADAVLDQTITLFRFVIDKDLFEVFYKRHLARRLIQGRSVSDDAERGMLAKLKVECGVQFTQKMEGMFNDMRTSADTMKAYKSHIAKTDYAGIDLSVNVLTASYWPMTANSSPCVFPPVLIDACQSFERFYLARHSGRRVVWQPSYGTADVKVQFKAKKHELNVSTHALVVLLLFEDLPENDLLSYQDIRSATDIPENDLKRTLQSLACGKYKILLKEPRGRDIGAEDEFSFNSGFTAPLARIKIATIASKVESNDERKETREKVDEDRKHQIEACIVRIMKSRKAMNHNELVNEVTRQLAGRFAPSPQIIKKRIEALIEREYLERAEDRKSYRYLA